MQVYTCLFVDHGGHPYASEHFQCADDAEAVAQANRAYASGVGNGIELWRGETCIFVRNAHYAGEPGTGHP